MLNVPGHPELKKIVVLNPKGGSGKSTLVTNLAGMLAARDQRVALMDCDPQGSSTRWLSRRDTSRAPIHGIAAYERDAATTRSFQMRVPSDVRCLVVDTPAAVPVQDLAAYTRGAHAILVPVLPSSIDIHAVTKLVEKLLLVAKVSRRMGRLGVVANRVRENTVSFRKLKLFLNRLDIATVCQLRDSQSYVHAAEQGVCIHEMQPSRVAKDLAQWQPLIDWLALRLETPLTVRDLHNPSPKRRQEEGNVRYLADALANRAVRRTD